MIGETLRKMPVTTEPGSEIFNGFRMGDLDQESWILFSALRMAEKAEEKCPKIYPPLAQGLKHYCINRVEGMIPYDRSIAVRLGDWFQTVQRAHEDNLTHIDDLLWARDRMEKATPKQTRLVALCTQVLDRFYKMPFPADDMWIALQTKICDARDRDRNARGQS